MNSEPTNAFAPPGTNVEQPIDATLAGPWRRWLARNIDLVWQFGSITLAVGLVLGLTSSPLLDRLDAPGMSQLFGLVGMLAALILDAATHGLFGNTPAKALLGVRVLSRDGEKLSFSGHVGRNLHAWFSGFGLGIPLITLITMARQHGRVKAHKPASYDESTGRRVVAMPIGAARAFVGIVIYLGMVVGCIALATGP